MSEAIHTAIALELAALVRDLQQSRYESVSSALNDFVQNAAKAVPHADAAGVTQAFRDGAVQTVAATDEVAVVLDRIQQDFGQGPCLSAAWDQHTILVDDLSADHRWPRYRRDALARTAVRSVMSFRLFNNLKAVGALNFYAERAGVFGDEAVEVGLVYATHAAIAWDVQRRDEQFRSALASRDIIGQAKGMLMERFNIDAVRAFELLKRLSQDGNIPLVDVARRLVHADHPTS
ncbi:GAF and ANTAR domain-containing protein [Mycobacterium sp. GA-2829]|uniref:GAF and ANTAR domain-containing protein n=1 Tax=Mycobacterium sp. GA-2829 TaxID=1772283 RepID=UPI00073FB681|nr:GAF and ANTAR domain-containing protein [Mycobacterium sp. GA-2829]KUI39342.1 response regulator receiver protein [Mycobacterium sp. GA-2829]